MIKGSRINHFHLYQNVCSHFGALRSLPIYAGNELHKPVRVDYATPGLFFAFNGYFDLPTHSGREPILIIQNWIFWKFKIFYFCKIVVFSDYMSVNNRFQIFVCQGYVRKTFFKKTFNLFNVFFILVFINPIN